MGTSLRVMQIVSNLQIGGAQEVVRTLVENLSELGCTSVVCTFRDGSLRTEIENLGIPVEILPERSYSALAVPFFLMEVLQLRQELVRLVEKYEIDVIQTHLLRSFDFLVLSLRVKNGPKVFWTFHNSLFDLREDHLARNKWLLKPKRFSHHLLYSLGSRWVDGLVAVSGDVKKSILKTIKGVPAEKISVILNSVDVTRYGKNFNRIALRSKLGFGETEHLMAMVATFKRQKGHKVLVDAAATLIPDFPHLHFLFVGDGELIDELRNQVRELNLEQNIHFLGMRNDIPEILVASDSFVLPSLWEGLPMALIEAMASGLPVIATDVSGTRQVLESGKTGIMVEPGDAQVLAYSIMELLNNPEQAQVMGKTARKKMETMFSAKKQAEEYLTLFEKTQGLATLSLASSDGDYV